MLILCLLATDNSPVKKASSSDQVNAYTSEDCWEIIDNLKDNLSTGLRSSFNDVASQIKILPKGAKLPIERYKLGQFNAVLETLKSILESTDYRSGVKIEVGKFLNQLKFRVVLMSPNAVVSEPDSDSSEE